MFRHGVVVLSGLTPLEEDEVLRALEPRIVGPFAPPYEEESLLLQAAPRRRGWRVAPDGVASG